MLKDLVTLLSEVIHSHKEILDLNLMLFCL